LFSIFSPWQIPLDEQKKRAGSVTNLKYMKVQIQK